MHLDDDYSVISSQIVHFPLKFANDAMHTVKFRGFGVLNHAIILGMLFLHKFNLIAYCQNETITCQHLQLTSVSPSIFLAAPPD